jgi:hypothetical protein
VAAEAERHATVCVGRPEVVGLHVVDRAADWRSAPRHRKGPRSEARRLHAPCSEAPAADEREQYGERIRARPLPQPLQ